MTAVLIDANVLLDVMTEDARWLAWPASAVERAADRYRLVINPVVYAEVSIRYSRIEELDAALPKTMFAVKPFRTKPPFSQASHSWPIDGGAEQGNRRSPIFSSARMRPLPDIC
ncbi:MAG TPA: hypothetical protein VHX61_19415 [Rhizomicrobium sp.]|jgi:predicted nucleic acid-binding protein|nr:hypothetical protein [Rhizomicrobium sp.]